MIGPGAHENLAIDVLNEDVEKGEGAGVAGVGLCVNRLADSHEA